MTPDEYRAMRKMIAERRPITALERWGNERGRTMSEQELHGDEGQDRESYSDHQDRKTYAPNLCINCEGPLDIHGLCPECNPAETHNTVYAACVRCHRDGELNADGLCAECVPKIPPRPWELSRGAQADPFSLEAPACTVAHLKALPRHWDTEATAEYIRAACNAHDDLVANAQAVVDAYGCECLDGEPQGHCPMCGLRAALAKTQP